MVSDFGCGYSDVNGLQMRLKNRCCVRNTDHMGAKLSAYE